MKQKHIVIDARIRSSSTGRYADRLLEHLQQLDQTNRYTILLDPSDKWLPTAKNFEVKACVYKKFSFNLIDQLTFSRFIKALEPDLVHFTMTPQEPVFYSGKRVTTTHDLTMLRYARAGKLPEPIHKLRMLGYRFLLWHSHRVNQRIIVPTNFVKKDLSNYQPFTADKITVTLESSEPPLKVPSDPLAGVHQPFIMHVGSPFPHKNIERLIDAFSQLKETYPELQLVLAGKKEYYFEQLINQKIADSKYSSDIIIPGFIEDSELKWLYENAECYTLPSLSEGFGLPGLEAMAHGTPLVSSNETCLPEVYGDAAEYFDPNDTDSLVEAVKLVLSDKKRADQLRHLGYKQIKKYSWQKMAEQTLAVYNQVINQ